MVSYQPRSILHHGRPPLLPPPRPQPFRRREQAQLAACARLGVQRARRGSARFALGLGLRRASPRRRGVS